MESGVTCNTILGIAMGYPRILEPTNHYGDFLTSSYESSVKFIGGTKVALWKTDFEICCLGLKIRESRIGSRVMRMLKPLRILRMGLDEDSRLSLEMPRSNGYEENYRIDHETTLAKITLRW